MINVLQSRMRHRDMKIATRVLDGRDLNGMDDDSFTHTFSTYMICLAPKPNKFAREIFRVTKPGGILGLAVWADPYFGYFNTPWTKACRIVMPDYEPFEIMDEAWTSPRCVKAGLEEAGFRDLNVTEESQCWTCQSVAEMA